MQRMRTELLAWMMEANVNQKQLGPMFDRGRTYGGFLLRGKYNWSVRTAEQIDAVVGFSDEAWDEAYAAWEETHAERYARPSISQIIAQHKAANHPLHRKWA